MANKRWFAGEHFYAARPGLWVAMLNPEGRLIIEDLGGGEWTWRLQDERLVKEPYTYKSLRHAAEAGVNNVRGRRRYGLRTRSA